MPFNIQATDRHAHLFLFADDICVIPQACINQRSHTTSPHFKEYFLSLSILKFFWSSYPNVCPSLRNVLIFWRSTEASSDFDSPQTSLCPFSSTLSPKLSCVARECHSNHKCSPFVHRCKLTALLVGEHWHNNRRTFPLLFDFCPLYLLNFWCLLSIFKKILYALWSYLTILMHLHHAPSNPLRASNCLSEKLRWSFLVKRLPGTLMYLSILNSAFHV